MTREVHDALKDLGLSFQNRYTGSNWAPDLVAKTDDGTRIVIEVKSRDIAAPDVFAVASTTSSGSFAGRSASGAIISDQPAYRSIASIANENNVILLTIGRPEELKPKLRFLEIIARIETILRQMSNSSSEKSVPDVVESLTDSRRMSPDLRNRVLNLWRIRGKLAHYTERDEEFDEGANNDAQAVLNDLRIALK